MSTKQLIFVAISIIALSGCAETHAGLEPIDPADFGEANRQTYAAMIINPDPQYEEPMATSADHAAQAIERYREGAVVEPETVTTTSGLGGGGGGGN